MIPFAWMCVTADSTWSPKESHPDTKNLRFHVASPPTSPPVAWHVPPKPLGCASGILWRRLSTSWFWTKKRNKSQMSTKKKTVSFSIKTKIKVKSLPLLFFVELRLFFFRRLPFITVHMLLICWEKRVTGRNSSRSPHRCAYEALHENNGPWPGHPVWNPSSPFPLKIHSKQEPPT